MTDEELRKAEARETGAVIGLMLFEIAFSFLWQAACVGFLLACAVGTIALLFVFPPAGIVVAIWFYWQLISE